MVPGGGSGEFRLERVAGGQSNPSFFITLGPRRMVMRKKPAGVTLPSAHAGDREYRVLTAVADTDVPAPRTILYSDDESIVGTPFYLMERLAGRVFHDTSLPASNPRNATGCISIWRAPWQNCTTLIP